MPPLRGVNLGGWLILEPWIKPSLFDVCSDASVPCPIDEHSLCELLGPTQSKAVMHHHWDSFVRFEDLAELKQAGINALRIPVGYWIIAPQPDEPYVSGGLAYLLRALGWAQQLGLKAIVELHAAPGRQNNMDHSGWKDHMGWTVSACPSSLAAHVAATLAVLEKLVDVFTQHKFIETCPDEQDGSDGGSIPCGTVIGLGLFNEPISFDRVNPVDHSALVELYTQALAHVVPPSIYALLDMFEGFEWLVKRDLLSVGVPGVPGRRLIAFDKHRYVGFSDKGMRGARDEAWLASFACAAMSDGFDLPNATATAAERGEVMAPLIFGEWSVAVNDCMPWLGGARNRRTNYACCGLGDCLTTPAARDPRLWSAEERAHRWRYAARQMEAMEQHGSLGWFYWTFRTDPPSEWSYLDGVRTGFLPADASRPSWQKGGSPLCPADAAMPGFCTATDPGCDLCLARDGMNETCRPGPLPAPPSPPTPCPPREAIATGFMAEAPVAATANHPAANGGGLPWLACATLLAAFAVLVVRLRVRRWGGRRRREASEEPLRGASRQDVDEAAPYLLMEPSSAT